MVSALVFTGTDSSLPKPQIIDQQAHTTMGDHFTSTPDSFSVPGGPISRLLPHTLTRTINIAVEEIFRDLMTDTHQAEEVLKNQLNSLNFDRKELDLEENTAEDRESVARAPSDRWLKALDVGSVNATIRTELVEALVVLGEFVLKAFLLWMLIGDYNHRSRILVRSPRIWENPSPIFPLYPIPLLPLSIH